MKESIGEQFERAIQDGLARLSGVSEGQAETTFREGGWTRKEILGHLIDSAVNNRIRFVCGALHGEFHGPTYEQQGWVRIHGYGEMPWAELVNDWHSHNRMLARVAARVPRQSYEELCWIGHHAPMSLLALMEDYLAHLGHHLDQIASGVGAPVPVIKRSSNAGSTSAVRVGAHVAIGGTNAVNEQGVLVGAGDAYAQAMQALANVRIALERSFARMDDVVRIRFFVTHIAQREEVARAFAEVFEEPYPALTVVQVVQLTAPDMLVEIEADAICR